MYMRVNKIVKSGYISAMLNGKEIAKKKQVKYLPGEMINFKINKDLLEGQTGELSFEIKED